MTTHNDHDNGADMGHLSVMSSQIAGNSTVWRYVNASIKENIKASVTI